MTTANPDIIPMQQVADASGFQSWLWRQGPWVVLAILTLAVLDYQFIIPMAAELREQSKEVRENAKVLTKAVAESSANQAATLAVQRQQADALDRLSKNQEETNRIQQQLLDATRRGAWLDKPSGKAGT